MTKLSETNGYHRTDNATATAADIATGKTAYIAGGQVTGTLPLYTPAMMEFDGSTGYYSDASVTPSGNKVTFVARFNREPFTGAAASEFIARAAGTYDRGGLVVYSSDFATADNAGTLRFRVQNSVGTVICQLFSTVDFCDGNNHTVFASFDADAGTAMFIIDGVDVDDTGNASRIAPTTGTLLNSGISYYAGSAGGFSYFGGQLGFNGYDDSYLTNWSDFMYTDGSPKALDETTWTEWGAQPLFWNEHGDMENNLGSAGAMTRNGTIVVGKGGN